jgi:alpha/beta superfamily hydrolase
MPHGHLTGAVIYFNGRRESPTTIFRFLTTMKNQAVVVYYYRGLGPSTGALSEPALVDDGLKVLDWLCAKTQLPTSLIVIIGRSLGSGIAVQVAASRNVAGMILISPFDSLVNVIRQRIRGFPNFLVQDKFKSEKHISKVGCSILSITGGRDTTIPTRLTKALFSQWGGQLTEHNVPEGRHRGLLRYASVETAVACYLPIVLGEAVQ